MASGAQSGRVDMTGALRDAGFTGLIAFGVLLPLIGFLTGVDGSNKLILTTRWPLLVAIVAVIVACRFLYCFAITPWLAHAGPNSRFELRHPHGATLSPTGSSRSALLFSLSIR